MNSAGNSGADSRRSEQHFGGRGSRWQRYWARWQPLCFGALVLLAACGDKEPRLAPIGADENVIAFGDSLTYGTGAGGQESYPAVLQQLIGLKVINAGVPGEVTAEALARLPGLLQRHRPALVILCHGGNDMLRRLSAETVYNNLETLVDQVRAHGAEVMLVGVPKPRLLFLKPAELYDRLATEHGLVYLRDALPELESDPAMKSDPIHLNGEGYRQLAAAIYRLLQSAGALTTQTDSMN